MNAGYYNFLSYRTDLGLTAGVACKTVHRVYLVVQYSQVHYLLKLMEFCELGGWLTKASSRYRLRCTSLTGNLFTSTTVRVTIECRKPLINLPYIRTFGMPDQGQMLDVRESQTIEAGFPKRRGSLDIKTDHVIILTQDYWS